MEEIVKRNFLALNQTIKKQREELSSFHLNLKNVEQQNYLLRQEIEVLKNKLNILLSKQVGSGPTQV